MKTPSREVLGGIRTQRKQERMGIEDTLSFIKVEMHIFLRGKSKAKEWAK